MYKRYGEVAQFFIVYIKEAHPSDDWKMSVDKGTQRFIKDPVNTFERFQVANSCMNELDISIPCLIDEMENAAAYAYKGWPDRLYVVGKEGKIAYHGGPGPRGFLPADMEAGLVQELKNIGVDIPTEPSEPAAAAPPASQPAAQAAAAKQ